MRFLILIARVLAALGLVSAVAMFGGPGAQAHHTIDFDTYTCGNETPEPGEVEEPELTPPPTEEPDGDGPPPAEEPTPAPQNCMPAEGDRIWGNRTLRFSVSTSPTHPLKRVSLFILSEEEAVPHALDGEDLVAATFSRDQDVRTYDTPFIWNSREVTPYNGRYKVVVEAETYPSAIQGGHVSSAERTGLRVDNVPMAVGAPKIVTTTVGSVTLAWDAATEPDVLSYQVFRATSKGRSVPPYSAFKVIGAATSAGFRDGSVSPGNHWYAVKVTRRSVVTPDSGISSQLSARSAAAEVKSLEEIEEEQDDGKTVRRKIAYRNVAPPRVSSRLAAVPDAPFAYKLPYDDEDTVPESALEGSSSEGGTDPRGAVLPVAVGMFLVSSALAVGRMPY